MHPIINFLILNASLLDQIRSKINESGLESPVSGNSVFDIIALIIQFGFSVAGIIAVGFLVYGGIMYILAGGAQDKTQAAIKIITNAIIGLVITLAALVIIQTVKQAIGAREESGYIPKSNLDEYNPPSVGLPTGNGYQTQGDI